MAKVSRRGFLRTVVVSAGAASVAPSLIACGGPARPVDEVFPQSIASGDPRTASIVLWTRAVPERESEDAAVTLELATDEAFANRVAIDVAQIAARADHDHCLRVKVVGLDAGTTYHYRFTHAGTTSHPGRFRTAPAEGADVPVRFAFVSCQDFVGRYYNTLLRLLDEDHDDLAFVLHLGDYVYETTGDPGFMSTGSQRAVSFRAPDEAIALESGGEVYYAARSASNYRDLYRAYRSDPILQRVHERFAFICMWDDHEFSDDCWGESGTYSDGVLDEVDPARRLASEQVYFEYMPVALDAEGAGALTVDRAALYPNTRLYRDFRFGRHLTLAVTDYRSFRPDHPTPENAFPGAIVLGEPEVRAALARLEADGELADAAAAFTEGGFRTYVDLDEPAYSVHARALQALLMAGYVARGVPEADAIGLSAQYGQGLTDAAILQETIDAGRASLPAELAAAADVDASDPALSRGLPYAMMGKTGLTGQLGSRYLTVQRAYELVAAWRTRVDGDRTHDDVLGAEQEAWLREVASASSATWTVIGNSVCNTSLVLDLGPFGDMLPPGLPPERFYLNVDHWDGFPERRRALMRDVYRPANAILLAGDIHAAYATDFGADASGDRVVELTTPGVSSSPFRDLLMRTGNAVPAIRDSGLIEPVLAVLDFLMMQAFPALSLARSDVHGVSVVRVDGSALRADFHLLPPELTSERHYERPADLDGRWEVVTYTVAKQAGKNGPLTLVE